MKYLHSGLVVMAGVLGAAAATGFTDHDEVKISRKSDIREAILRRFLRENRSPVEGYAGTFIQEADAHKLDWRLLPSLAIVESGAGKHERKNNLFGWNNGASRFQSATEAIHHVAEALAEARPYRGKTTSGKLAAYKSNPRLSTPRDQCHGEDFTFADPRRPPEPWRGRHFLAISAHNRASDTSLCHVPSVSSPALARAGPHPRRARVAGSAIAPLIFPL